MATVLKGNKVTGRLAEILTLSNTVINETSREREGVGRERKHHIIGRDNKNR